MEKHTLKVPYQDFDRIMVSSEFISENSFLLRPVDEIQSKIEQIDSENRFFDFRNEVLVSYLPFDKAKPLFKEEYVLKVESGEEQYSFICTIEECVQDFLDYMVFAWGKALDERGISASRSVSKLGAWLWLMNREDLSEIITDDSLYNPYGSPALISVCEQLGISVPNELIEFSKNKC